MRDGHAYNDTTRVTPRRRRSGGSNDRGVAHVQRVAGNRAVARLISNKDGRLDIQNAAKEGAPNALAQRNLRDMLGWYAPTSVAGLSTGGYDPATIRSRGISRAGLPAGFTGAGNATVAHLTDIKYGKNNISGCHDDATFRNVLATGPAATVGGGKTPTTGVIQNEAVLHPNVNVIDYQLHKRDGSGALYAKMNRKTTIVGLAGNPDPWKAKANEAVFEDNIDKWRLTPTTVQHFDGSTAAGETVEFYWNAGNEVDTFFFT